MEIQRLKPMDKDYPVDLFNKLYKETKQLRKSLTYHIDSRRYGVTPDIIESWFDDKFLFVFNKYYKQHNENDLKAFIINSLVIFKKRVLRKAYTEQAENFYSNTITIDGELDVLNLYKVEDIKDEENNTYNIIYDYMRNNLSADAFIVFDIQINTPPYIMSRLKTNKSIISNELIIEYLSINKGSYEASLLYVKKLKKEISKYIKKLKVITPK